MKIKANGIIDPEKDTAIASWDNGKSGYQHEGSTLYRTADEQYYLVDDSYIGAYGQYSNFWCYVTPAEAKIFIETGAIPSLDVEARKDFERRF